MPWKNPYTPSIQLGCLKAYIDSKYNNDDVRVYTYSAYVDIALKSFNKDHDMVSSTFKYLDELSYFLLVTKHFNPLNMDNPAPLYSKMIPELTEKGAGSATFAKSTAEAKSLMRSVKENTIEYLEKTLATKFESNKINIIGFSVAFNQLYASIFAYYYLYKKYTKKYNLIFLFGGASIGSELTLKLLKRYKVRAFTAIGEGEGKIERFIQTCLDENNLQKLVPRLRQKIKDHKQGFFYLDKEGISSQGTREADACFQLPAINDLPLPDYDEYFASIQRAKPDHANSEHLQIPLEGSRGCARNCDFCGLNKNWKGFRKKDPENIYKQLLKIGSKHKCHRITFVDNTCESWISTVSSKLLESKDKFTIFAELRTAHKQPFWRKISKAGFMYYQLGCESLSDPLLKRMNKGIRVIDNLRALKYCCELGVTVYKNLIIYHPKTKVDDVLEMERVLKYIPHLGKFELAEYEVTEGSPIYNSLSNEEKKDLIIVTSYNVDKKIQSLLPGKLKLNNEDFLSKETIEATDRFKERYLKLKTKYLHLKITSQTEDKTTIYDNRYTDGEIFTLQDAHALIYDICHQGLTQDEIFETTEFDHRDIMSILDDFIDSRLMIKVGPHYLSLALRQLQENPGKYAAA